MSAALFFFAGVVFISGLLTYLDDKHLPALGYFTLTLATLIYVTAVTP